MAILKDLIVQGQTKGLEKIQAPEFVEGGVSLINKYATSANVVTALNKKPDVAFKTIKINATNLDADTSADTLTISAGTNVTLTPDANNDKFVISSKDTLPGKLTTTATTSLSTATNEPLSGTVSLHKIAKTGNFNDLVNKPENIGQSTVVVRIWQQSGGDVML